MPEVPIFRPMICIPLICMKQCLKGLVSWGNPDQLMFVIGATKAEKLTEIRKIIPNHFLLVPGVGAQGGSASEVCNFGMNSDGGLLINSSRGIIYASSKEDFARSSQNSGRKLQKEMSGFIGRLLT